MGRNKIKNVLSSVGLGLAILLTTAIGVKAVGSFNGNSNSGAISSETNSERYGKLSDGTSPSEYAVESWVKEGYISELLDAGYITSDEADKYRNTEKDDELETLYNKYNKYLVKSALESGTMTQEEADLYYKYYESTTEDEANKRYADIMEYNVKIGRITQEEAEDLKIYYGI